MSPLASKTLEIAGTQDGVQEHPKGSNAGPEVESYLASVGLLKGNPWCMAFVYWCVVGATKAINVPNPLIKTGGVHYQWDHIEASHKQSIPQVGDIFIMEFGSGNGHTGLVTAVVADQVHTIEGNSNENHSREGFEVIRHWRPIASFKGFIRI